jgi:membrane protease YdiL (CAAX protease family)
VNVNSDLHSVPSTLGHVLLFLIAVALPIWDLAEAKRLRANCTSKDRLRYYRTILGALWLLTIGSVWYLGWGGVLTAGTALGEAGRAMSNPYLRYGLLTLAGLFVVAALSPVLMSLKSPKVKAAYARQVAKTPFAFIFPTTPIERRYFAALSVSAGVCEEIIFRSFLISYFHSPPFSFAVFLGLLLSSFLFGINHGYQGWVGVLKTGVGGFLFGLVYFTTGSLILAMLLHAVTDLQVLALMQPPRDPESIAPITA